MNPFSRSIDIKRFQNLLETSVDETERRKLQTLLAKEKAKPPHACKPEEDQASR